MVDLDEVVVFQRHPLQRRIARRSSRCNWPRLALAPSSPRSADQPALQAPPVSAGRDRSENHGVPRSDEGPEIGVRRERAAFPSGGDVGRPEIGHRRFRPATMLLANEPGTPPALPRA
jgi:hypothetical protein